MSKTKNNETNIVFITGMASTGKSTILKELSLRGYHVVDTDSRDWCYYEKDSNWGLGALWDEEKINILLENQKTGTLFIAGYVVNQRRFYDYFDRIILLTAPLSVLQSRMNVEQDWEVFLNYKERIEPILQVGVDHIVDTNQEIKGLVDKIESLVQEKN